MGYLPIAILDIATFLAALLHIRCILRATHQPALPHAVALSLEEFLLYDMQQFGAPVYPGEGARARLLTHPLILLRPAPCAQSAVALLNAEYFLPHIMKRPARSAKNARFRIIAGRPRREKPGSLSRVGSAIIQ